MRMRKVYGVSAALVLMILLGACSALMPGATLASSEAAVPVRGGGPAVVSGGSQEGVVVSGIGVASAEPEVAEVTFGVDLQGKDPDALVSEAAEKMNAAMDAAKAFGILEDKTQTVSYNLWVETVHDRETGRPTGEIVYHLDHSVRVTTDRINAVGELLAEVVKAGANVILNVNFTVEDPDELVSQARDAALADAKARAEQIAGQLGIELGRPVFVTETGGGYPVSAPVGLGGGAGKMVEMAAPNVASGSFSVTVNVQVVYEIK